MIDHGSPGPGGALGPEARALLDAARPGLAPDAAAVRRMRGEIARAAGAAGMALGVKLALLALAVVAAVGGGVAVSRRAAVAVVPRVELASPPEPAVQVAVREAAPPPVDKTAPPSVDEDLITIEPTEAAPRHAGPAGEASRGARVERASPSRPASAPTIDLAREVELLDVAMAALRHGDPRGARRAVQQHAVETAGRGQLAEDAAAIEIEALCALRDPAARAKLDAFDARFPRSAQRTRLSDRCP